MAKPSVGALYDDGTIVRAMGMRRTLDKEASRLQRRLDASGAVVKPRFGTPLEKELAA